MFRIELMRCCALLAVLVLLAPSAASAQMRVQVAPVVRAPIVENLPLSGSVVSPRASSVAPQESGRVESIAVDAGDRVKRGDLLLELDDSLTRLEHERLEAQLEQDRLEYEDTRRIADEGRQLIQDRNISQTEYRTRLAREAAEAVGVRQLEIQLRVAELRLQRHQLRAPFDGVIALKRTEEGQWLGAGAAAFDLVQLDPLRIEARVPERYFSVVREGTPVQFEIDAWPGRRWDARVDRVVVATDDNSRSFRIWATVPNPELELAPGMSAQVVLRLGSAAAPAVIQVPADALVRRADGTVLVWRARDGSAWPITVQPGRRQGAFVEVTVSGDETLNESDRVITLGNEDLQPGDAIVAIGESR